MRTYDEMCKLLGYAPEKINLIVPREIVDGVPEGTVHRNFCYALAMNAIMHASSEEQSFKSSCLNNLHSIAVIWAVLTRNEHSAERVVTLSQAKTLDIVKMVRKDAV